MPPQQAQLETYLDLLLEANQRFNLTAITGREQAWDRHIVECLRLAAVVNSILPPSPEPLAPPARALDLGSGGGLPGMVLAIARPDIKFTLLEATAKKAHFLDDTAQRLGLANVSVLAERAELAAAPGAELRARFALVTARAVAPLPVLLELAIPFLKVDGTLLAVKGERAQEELTQATRAASLLHAEATAQMRHPTATVMLFRKTAATASSYPRRPGEPKRKPL
jgi:16S rRNA (guanine527-N7)-methyltransferase